MNPVYLPPKDVYVGYLYPMLEYIRYIPCANDFYPNPLNMTKDIIQYLVQLRAPSRVEVVEVSFHGHRMFQAGERVPDYSRNIKRRMYLLS